MGISVALSPATTTVTMSKSMITNASFRTKKLPGNAVVMYFSIYVKHHLQSADMLNVSYHVSSHNKTLFIILTD